MFQLFVESKSFPNFVMVLFPNQNGIETFSSKNGDGVSEVLEIIGGLKN